MNSTPKPGDFPIGSVDSRAAMRAMIEGEKRDPGKALRVTLERSGEGIIKQYEVAGPDDGVTHELRVILERVGG
jgi:hypothetical protein